MRKADLPQKIAKALHRIVQISAISIFTVICVGLFQNCGQTMVGKSFVDTSKSEEIHDDDTDTDPDPLPHLTPVPIKMNDGTSSYSSMLRWQSPVIASDTQRLLNRVVSASTGTDNYTAFIKTAPIVAQWDTEGKLPNDPIFASINNAKMGLDRLITVAMCARYAQDVDLAKQCSDAAAAYVRQWLRLSKPTGNPINDTNYLNLILAIDLMLPVMLESDVTTARAWLLTLIDEETKYMNSLPSTDGRLKNNWMTWRLTLRSLAGAILNDQRIIAETKTLLVKHLRANLAAPTGWKSSNPTPTPGDPNCRNQSSIDEMKYGSIDFRLRDAIQYHVFNLEALAFVQAFYNLNPDNSADTEIINNAYTFLEPYVVGNKTHLEWKCTSIQLDIDRRNTGDPKYQIANFKPSDFSHQMRLFRIAYPASKAWTQNFITPNYAPWQKLWYALRGDTSP